MNTLTGSIARPASDSSGSRTFSSKTAILLFAKYAGLFMLARFATAGKTRILAYHGIWLGDGHFGNFLYMSPGKFAARMALLKKWRYPVVGLDDAFNTRRCETVITIDDGWYGTWSKMLPVLEAHGYPATVYLTTYYCLNQVPVLDVALSYCFERAEAGRERVVHLPRYGFGPLRTDTPVARKRALAAALALAMALKDDAARQQFLEALCASTGVDYARLKTSRWFSLMNASEVKDAAGRGIRFEAHTHRHRISHQGEPCLAAEIAANRECIHKLSGRNPVHFCYPSGRYSSELWPVLEACQMASATTTEIGLVGARTPRYAMPRILDGEHVSELEFEAELSGFMELVRVLRQVGRRTP